MTLPENYLKRLIELAKPLDTAASELRIKGESKLAASLLQLVGYLKVLEDELNKAND